MQNLKVAIQLEHVSKNFKKLCAVNDVSAELFAGKMYAIMGPSGAGKSTLLNLMGTLDVPSSGTIRISGQDVVRLSEPQRAALRSQYLGFVFQAFLLNPKMKAYENVMLPMYLGKCSKSEMKNRAYSLLDELGLRERANHFPKELSGGEQQRVALARALANDPACILADEPTGNLDPDNEQAVFEYLKRLSEQGKCVVVVSHNARIREYADEVLQMNRGSVLNFD
jgi:ABC-type lipoprotein export system ATPase subunit